MDGKSWEIEMKQNTIKNPIEFSGIGLHSGVNVNIKINPAVDNTGIVFKRTDIENSDNEIKALLSNVVDTRLGTTIANSSGAVVQTIEHFMASLWAADIDNAIVKIDNREIPIMDGSALPFLGKILEVGIQPLKENRKFLKVLKEIEVKNEDSLIKIIPADDYSIELSIEFPYGGIGKQSAIFDGEPETFIEKIVNARTFCNIKEIEYMKKNGLALGGSLENAMVFDENGVLNEDGFRCESEVVKHKILDCVGDMFTCGYRIKGHIIANKSGHMLNNQLLIKIFSDRDNYIIG